MDEIVSLVLMSAGMLQVKATMKAIKHTLTERWYAWENARWAAMEDPSIDLYADEASGQQVYDKSKEVEDQPGVSLRR